MLDVSVYLFRWTLNVLNSVYLIGVKTFGELYVKCAPSHMISHKHQLNIHINHKSSACLFKHNVNEIHKQHESKTHDQSIERSL